MGGGDVGRQDTLTVEVESFSYLQGVPSTASLVFDVRFLPNPYFRQELRQLAGDEIRGFIGELELVCDLAGEIE